MSNEIPSPKYQKSNVRVLDIMSLDIYLAFGLWIFDFRECIVLLDHRARCGRGQ